MKRIGHLSCDHDLGGMPFTATRPPIGAWRVEGFDLAAPEHPQRFFRTQSGQGPHQHTVNHRMRIRRLRRNVFERWKNELRDVLLCLTLETLIEGAQERILN